MSRSPSRSILSFKTIVLIVVLIGGWVYNRFFVPLITTYNNAPPSGTIPGMGKSRRNAAPPRQSTPEAQSTTQGNGGVLQRDIVRYVIDGDTVKLRSAGTIRLIGVDCPEKMQDGGSEATAFTTKALAGKSVEYELCGKQATDRYGRGLAFVYTVDANGRRTLFNTELIKQGYARVFSLRPCSIDETLWDGYYEEARNARRGLFKTLGEVPDPSAFKRMERAGKE